MTPAQQCEQLIQEVNNLLAQKGWQYSDKHRAYVSQDYIARMRFSNDRPHQNRLLVQLFYVPGLSITNEQLYAMMADYYRKPTARKTIKLETSAQKAVAEIEKVIAGHSQPLEMMRARERTWVNNYVQLESLGVLFGRELGAAPQIKLNNRRLCWRGVTLTYRDGMHELIIDKLSQNQVIKVLQLVKSFQNET